MPRNGSGTYTLPTGNPVVSGTTIESSWANTTLSDLASEMTNSLSRTGAGGMTGAFRAANGTSTVPGIAWADETGTGFYRAGTSDTRFVVQTAEVQKWTASGSSVTGTFTASGDVGIGTTSPSARLSVDSGSTALLANFNSTNANGGFLRFQNSGTSIGDIGSGANIVSPAAGAADFGINVRGANSLIFGINSARAMTLDASGNLGLGVTPSAWGVDACLEIEGGKAISFASNSGFINTNAYFNSGWKYITTSTAAQYQQDAGAHKWSTAPSGTAGNAITFTQAMTLDASGNLGVGTTSPSTRLHVAGGSTTEVRVVSSGDLTTGSVSIIRFGGSNSATSGYLGYGGTTSTIDLWNTLSGSITFGTNNTERARITSGGDLLVGTTSSSGLITGKNTTFSQYTAYFWNATTTGDAQFVGFGTENTVTSRGSIDYNRAGGLVRYNTTSDYRAKDILGPVANPGATIDALKVYEGLMKGATQPCPMLVAHETQEHAPYAVSGVKDEVNEDGTPKFQQMDVSSLVPLLIAEIQSLRARVAALEA